MRSRWFAGSNSLLVAMLLVAMAARAETRPHYGGTLRIQTQAAITQLPRDLASSNPLAEHIASLTFNRHALCAGVCKPTPGAFSVAEFVPGKKLTLVANDQFVGGRPYVDGIEILMGRSPREQMVALQLGRADVIDVPAENVRRASQEGVRVTTSSPIELVALVFAPNSDVRVREAVSLSADRAAIFNVLLGRQGEPTAALLPGWMTGYGFLFDAARNVTRARQLAVEAGRARPIMLTYDPQDALARAIADRVALDARAAGLNIVAGASATPEARLVRVTLPSAAAAAALAALSSALGAAPASRKPADPQELYQSEKNLRDEMRVVPLLHLPIAYGLAARVKGWTPDRGGAWSLADVWLEATEQKEQQP